MGNTIFRGLRAPKPLGRFSKKCTVDYVGDPTTHASSVVNLLKGGVNAHAWIVTLRRLFFLFFSFMRPATGRPIGPIIAVNGSNDAPWWRSRPFYGFVNKKYFPILHPKMWKIALHPVRIFNDAKFIALRNSPRVTLGEFRRAITLASLKIGTSCLHQTGGFRGRQFNGVI